jgi:predicted nucleic acid-binding protein
MPRPILDNALTRLEAFFEEAHTVAASEEVRLRAGRLLAVHALRAADALQLAAALVSCEEDERLVSLDQRLREAALLEGFVVIPE